MKSRRPRSRSTPANFDFGQFFKDVETTEGGPRRVEAHRAPKGGPRRVGGPEIRFFSSSATMFTLFSSLVGPFVEFLKRRGGHMCEFRVKPRSPKAESPNVHISRALTLQKHHQNSTEGPQEREEKNENCGGRGEKKSDILGVQRREGRGPAGGEGGEVQRRLKVQDSRQRFLGTKTEQKENEE